MGQPDPDPIHKGLPALGKDGQEVQVSIGSGGQPVRSSCFSNWEVIGAHAPSQQPSGWFCCGCALMCSLPLQHKHLLPRHSQPQIGHFCPSCNYEHGCAQPQLGRFCCSRSCERGCLLTLLPEVTSHDVITTYDITPFPSRCTKHPNSPLPMHNYSEVNHILISETFSRKASIILYWIEAWVCTPV